MVRCHRGRVGHPRPALRLPRARPRPLVAGRREQRVQAVHHALPPLPALFRDRPARDLGQPAELLDHPRLLGAVPARVVHLWRGRRVRPQDAAVAHPLHGVQQRDVSAPPPAHLAREHGHARPAARRGRQPRLCSQPRPRVPAHQRTRLQPDPLHLWPIHDERPPDRAAAPVVPLRVASRRLERPAQSPPPEPAGLAAPRVPRGRALPGRRAIHHGRQRGDAAHGARTRPRPPRLVVRPLGRARRRRLLQSAHGRRPARCRRGRHPVHARVALRRGRVGEPLLPIDREPRQAVRRAADVCARRAPAVEEGLAPANRTAGLPLRVPLRRHARRLDKCRLRRAALAQGCDSRGPDLGLCHGHCARRSACTDAGCDCRDGPRGRVDHDGCRADDRALVRAHAAHQFLGHGRAVGRRRAVQVRRGPGARRAQRRGPGRRGAYADELLQSNLA